jgi:hypothetical protein
MGKRFAILIGAAALGAALIAAGASATFRSVDDPRGDAKCFHERSSPQRPHRPCSDSTMRNAEIVRATAGHDGRRLKHTIRVVGRFQRGPFRGASLLINTDSDSECEFKLFAPGSAVRECGGGSARTGSARVDVHLHSVEIFFSKRAIGFPRFYGWNAHAFAGPPAGHAVDHVPNGESLTYIRHWLR